MQPQLKVVVSTRVYGREGREKLTLIVRHLVARLVDARKAEVTILAHLAIFSAVNDHGLVTSGTEFLAVSVFDRETDGFTTEPVA